MTGDGRDDAASFTSGDVQKYLPRILNASTTIRLPAFAGMTGHGAFEMPSTTTKRASCVPNKAAMVALESNKLEEKASAVTQKAPCVPDKAAMVAFESNNLAGESVIRDAKSGNVPAKRRNDAAQSANVERKSVKRDAWERQRCRSHASTMTLEEATLQEKASRMTPGATTLSVIAPTMALNAATLTEKAPRLTLFSSPLSLKASTVSLDATAMKLGAAEIGTITTLPRFETIQGAGLVGRDG